MFLQRVIALGRSGPRCLEVDEMLALQPLPWEAPPTQSSKERTCSGPRHSEAHWGPGWSTGSSELDCLAKGPLADRRFGSLVCLKTRQAHACRYPRSGQAGGLGKDDST